MTTPTSADPIMAAIGAAMAEGRAGNTAAARTRLLSLWEMIGVEGDPLHRCTLAHHLADLHDDAAEALAWDVRALDAATALTDRRVQEAGANLRVAGFAPSLHLNLADDYRRLGSFAAAREHIEAARERSPALPDDSYGDLIRRAIGEVADAIADRDTAPRASAPGRVN
ncbi:hypothetical protein B0I33_10479 [Prauserella shujinwangii]|uniref:Tetratricopeptide repeat protein n=1 Tax=Prauserella shujinwangii TaxID=1453103 RepID=A0A2T0LW65_9PSEU|nr:hypothetical protein [Prauserella shujinwangii]PRX48265.1 hypothetical protein B0I33_10479 [Prauserella shujinwangii]